MDTLGLVEYRSIAVGIAAADAIVKAAPVQLLRATTICSGRYFIVVQGDKAGVDDAMRAACTLGRVASCHVVAHVSSQVMAALRRPEPSQGAALGIVECRLLAAGVRAADAAVKQAEVYLARMVLGQGINGKMYFALRGDVDAVREAVAASRSVLGNDLIEAIVIARPDAEVIHAVIHGLR